MPEVLDGYTEAQISEAVRQFWKIGRLKYKLQPRQREAYEAIKSAPFIEEPYVLVATRGFGKTFIDCTIALEATRRHRNANVLIISSTLKKLRTIVQPAFDTLLEDCPPEFQPKYDRQDSVYAFPSGVNVHLVAAEKGHIKDIRGIHNVVLVIIDEAGFFGDEDDSFPLDQVIENIINPMFVRSEVRGRVIITTTPPDTPNHPVKKYWEAASLVKCTATFDIYQSDLPPERIEEEKRRCKDPLAWRRERLCEWVVDESRLIIPEWKSALYVQEVEKDPFFEFYHKYQALDTGVRDFTINLHGYYHFKRAALVLEDENLLKGEMVRTDLLATEIKASEVRLGYKKIHRRIGDNNNLIILQDLSGIHGLPFIPTTKDELFAMVNEVRLWINAGRLFVHPRMVYTIGCLENGIWTKDHKEFGRSATFGHFDALAALCYLIRHIDTNTNPIPPLLGLSQNTHSIPAEKQATKTYNTLKGALGIKKQLSATQGVWRR
jgi:hypothetical protein